MSYCLPRKDILRNKHDIAALFKNGQWIRGHYFYLVYRTESDKRVLFGTSKRIKPAVQRILYKRYAREVYRHHQEQIPPCHLGVILHALPGKEILTDLSHDFISLIDTLKHKML